MKKILTSIALALSTVIATSAAIAAPSHPSHGGHWKNPPPQTSPHKMAMQDKYSKHHRAASKAKPYGKSFTQTHFKKSHVNPSRDWRAGRLLPRDYQSKHFQVNYAQSKKMTKPARHHSWHRINGDYILVNDKTHRIVRIIH